MNSHVVFMLNDEQKLQLTFWPVVSERTEVAAAGAEVEFGISSWEKKLNIVI